MRVPDLASSGFTLLEVLVALAILSAVSLVAIRTVGDGLTSLGDNGWREKAIVLGRNQLINLERQGLKGNLQGTFSPDFPEISWKARIMEFGREPGRKLVLTISQDRHEASLERILVP